MPEAPRSAWRIQRVWHPGVRRLTNARLADTDTPLSAQDEQYVEQQLNQLERLAVRQPLSLRHQAFNTMLAGAYADWGRGMVTHRALYELEAYVRAAGYMLLANPEPGPWPDGGDEPVMRYIKSAACG